MKQPLVSVNITTFNRSQSLVRCIESVASQDYNNIEVIVVDDCSSDDTAEVVKSLQNTYDRIKYYKFQKNSGNAKARNKALELCTGKYVAFLDDDDYWIDDKKLTKQIRVLEQDLAGTIGIVCTGIRKYHAREEYEDEIIGNPSDLRKRIMLGNGFIYNSTVVTSKKIMDLLNGFDEKLPKGVDSDFFRRCIIRLKKDVYILPDITTAVVEYGHDRMTPLKSKEALLRECKSIESCLRKFDDEFTELPDIKFLRKKRLFKNYVKLAIKTANLRYIFSAIGVSKI